MRLPHLRADALDAAQLALYHRIAGGPRSGQDGLVPVTDPEGRLEGPFNALLFHPKLGAVVEEVGRALRYDGVLPPRTREIVVLTVAVAQRSAYEWDAHARLGAAAGLSRQELDGLAARDHSAFDDAAERTAAELAGVMVAGRDVGDELYSRADRSLGTAGVIEASVLVGYYRLLAQQLEMFRVPAPPGPWED